MASAIPPEVSTASTSSNGALCAPVLAMARKSSAIGTSAAKTRSSRRIPLRTTELDRFMVATRRDVCSRGDRAAAGKG